MATKVVCGISGGVDSAVAALLLKTWGFNVVGVFMRNWDVRDETGHCSAEEDCHFAKKVCTILRIPFHEVDFVKEYWTGVFQETLKEYECGRTPNPDVLCNKYIKFDAFYDYAKEKHGASLIATGHYARTSGNFNLARLSQSGHSSFGQSYVHEQTCGRLFQALDLGKDQTFFLNRVSSKVVKRTVFPLGNLLKKSVKEIAFLNKLDFVAKKKESMGICFIGVRDFSQFILDYVPPKLGNFVCLETGKVLGHHNGYFKYTIGQRARISVNSTAHFITGKNVETGDVYLAPGNCHHSLFSVSFITERFHWIYELPRKCLDHGVLKCEVRVMHREPRVGCDVHMLPDSKCLVILDRPLRAITAGQSAVLYSGNECLGGSKICNIGPSVHESYGGFLQLAKYRTDEQLWKDLFAKFGKEIMPQGELVEDLINGYKVDLDQYRRAISYSSLH